jgi:hypothetical protein
MQIVLGMFVDVIFCSYKNIRRYIPTARCSSCQILIQTESELTLRSEEQFITFTVEI